MGALACLAEDCAWIFGSYDERAEHVKTAHPGIALALPRAEQAREPLVRPSVACGVGTCDRTFGTKQAAAGHRFAKHKIRADGSSAGVVRPTVLTPHACKVIGCDRSFSTPHGLEVHVARTHQTPSPGPIEKEEPVDEPMYPLPLTERSVTISGEDRALIVEMLEDQDFGTGRLAELTPYQRRLVTLYARLVEG